MTAAWQDGLTECQVDMRSLGICPAQDKDSRWFHEPYKIGATTEAEMYQQMWIDNDNMNAACGLEEVEFHDNYNEDAENDLMNLASDELGSHLRHLADTDSLCEAETANSSMIESTESIRKKTSTISVPNVSAVHKSTLFSMLNSDPKNLSVDRLKRVRSKNTQSRDKDQDGGDEIGLLDDIAILIKGKKERSTLQTWKNY